MILKACFFVVINAGGCTRLMQYSKGILDVPTCPKVNPDHAVVS